MFQANEHQNICKQNTTLTFKQKQNKKEGISTNNFVQRNKNVIILDQIFSVWIFLSARTTCTNQT